MVTTVPLANDPGGVAVVLKEAGNRDLIGVQSLGLTREEHRGIVDAATTETDP